MSLESDGCFVTRLLSRLPACALQAHEVTMIPASALPPPAVLAYLAALLTGDWPATREVDQRAQRQASGLVSAFANWHLERGLRSLTHVDR